MIFNKLCNQEFTQNPPAILGRNYARDKEEDVSMIKNLRDFSGYKNKNGKRIKKGNFYRSAALCNLNRRDKRFLNMDPNLTVIDLRGMREREESPDYEVPYYYPVSLHKGAVTNEGKQKESSENLLKLLPDMQKLYREFITDEYCINAIAEVFSHICDPERQGRIIWHCGVGKDRTGLISALFMKMMDFDEKIIMKDYMKSARSVRGDVWKTFFVTLFCRRHIRLAFKIKKVFSVREEYLIAAFKEIKNTYGDFDLFFLRIGVTDEVKKRMQETYLK